MTLDPDKRGKLPTGLIRSFLFAAVMYYAKWACYADLATGDVDNDRFGAMSMAAGMMGFFPPLVGTAIAAPLMKLFKSPEKFHRMPIYPSQGEMA